MIGSKQRDVRVRTKSERLLLKTYGQDIPTSTDAVSGVVDPVSVDILNKFHSVVLQDVYPAKTQGDGNCLYRAVSRALTGSEAFHILLRIYTLLEILSFPMFYDADHSRYTDLLQDNRIVVATYLQLAHDVGTLGAYADLLHIYALSAAMNIPIRSYYPPHLSMEFVSQPYSRKVCGRGVNASETQTCTVMWTQMQLTPGPFVPNHFVPLLRKHYVDDHETETFFIKFK